MKNDRRRPTLRARSIPLLALSLALAAAACGDPPMEPEPERVVLENPSFAADILEIVQRNGCAASGCHGDQPYRANLNLNRAAAYEQLIGVTAFMEPDFIRVVPGSVADSYLMIKLEGRQQEGLRMPRNGTPLDQIDMTNIANWIENGAPNN